MDKKFILILFSVLVFLPFISSAPPFINSIDFDDGYRLVTSEMYYLKVSEPHQFNFFVYNKSDGTLQDNSTITCTFYLANSSGEVLTFLDVPYFSDGHWGIDILGGNFSYIGVYAYGLKCEDGVGGAMTGTWETTYTGKEYPEGIIQIVFIIGFLIIIFFLGSLFISNLGHFAQGDYDLGELIKNVSLYFVVIAFYFLHAEYLALPLMNTILIWLIGIGGFTHVAVSFFAFIYCYLKQIMEYKTKVREYGE